jgi:hypothetical protein
MIRYALLLSVALLSSCSGLGSSPSTPSSPAAPTTAALAITVAPDPLHLLTVCPAGDRNCYASLDATVTITETAGVAGKLTSIQIVLQDGVAGIPLHTETLDSAWIVAHLGTDRIGARGSLAVRPIVEGYPYPAGTPLPPLAVTINVAMTDDNGHTIVGTKRVPLQTS